ncbi:putative acetylornithine aminotransferase [Talaromyces proteolyticus]|uniref:Acetylornithine aminotransferase n=1 Tax=Talaromyces proteolyticus TaxID=1131652 RepID=A0AAD4KRR3_9EURO|nr:putative acetylornithine aminotransferase [Talaromyces proteolyticus]KAH8698945.1 putative acetylornithine aminotransferase [Talaromyces proteolyticus]
MAILSVSSALAEARDRYVQRNPVSRKLHEESYEYMPGGNTRTILHVSPFPITFTSGKDATLTSVDHDTYTDFLGEYSAGIFGHSNVRIAEAVREGLSNGWNYGGQTIMEKEMAKKVVTRFRPSGMEMVRFTNSGTESNTVAIAAALNFTKRRKILVFSSGYHGGTLIFPMDLMKNPATTNVNLPHDFVFAPYNNIGETTATIKSLPTASLAAIMVEPIQGSGGCRPATKEFLQYLRETADAQKCLLIVDEVMASRLGPNGCSATMGIKADLMSLGKYVGGGMTFGAFGGRRDVMELFDPEKSGLQHPGTYNNNVVTMSAGIVALDIYNASEVERLNAFGADFKTKLQEVLIRHHRLPVMFVTGRGSMLNVRFSGPHAPELRALYYFHMLENYIYLAPRGYTPLNLELKDQDVLKYLAVFENFIVKYNSVVKH